MRTVVEECVGDEIFAPNEQSSALRSSHRFSTAECDEVVTHVCIVPKMGNGWSIGGGIDERRDVILLAQLHPLLDFDLPERIGKVAEMHHRRLVVDGVGKVFPALNFDEPHAGCTKLVIKGVSMGFLNYYLRFHSC